MDPNAFIMLTTPPANPGDFDGFVIFALAIIGLALLPYYLLRSIALFRISNRRGIFRAWLSWVPIGSSWVQGCISDQYQKVVFGKTTKRRLWMPLLHGLCTVCYIVMLLLLIPILPVLDGGALTGLFAIARILVVLFAAVSIAAAVLGWISLYDLFRSCEPEKSGVYLVICLVVRFCVPMLEIIREILMLMVSKKDLGMRPADLPRQESWEQKEE